MMPGLVCIHVMKQGQPLKLVSHQESQHPDDSGWLLACGQTGHEDADWMVEDVEPLIEQNGLRPLLAEIPVDHEAQWSGQEWEIAPTPAEDMEEAA